MTRRRTMTLRQPLTTMGRGGCLVIQLEAGALAGDPSSDSPKWVQVTREGNFPGYMGGLKPFSFTRADLEAMVQNVKLHPAYALDSNGVPVGQVIPWDFNHASEQDPTTGELPVSGAPAQGWTYDLQVRVNEANGVAELWALTKFLEPARSYVKAGQYKWASVAVALNATDPESGSNIGALVTSIALTNTPFVEGMRSLVASKTAAIKPGEPTNIELRRSFYGPAQTPEEAIGNMRELFGLLETSGIADVISQLQIVKSWLTAGAPMGTDPDYIIGSLRTILNLPSLASPEVVLDEALKALPALIQSQGVATGTAAPLPPVDAGTVPPVTASRKEQDMTTQATLLITLAGLLGVRESEDAVAAATKELVALRAGLRTMFGLELGRDTNDVMLESAKGLKAAKDKLLGIFTALGVADPDAAVAKVAETMASAARLKEVMPELEGLRADKKQKEEQEAESDVDAAIAASKLPVTLKPALLLHRKTNPTEFAKEYPKGALVVPAVGASPALRATLTKSAPVGGTPAGGQAPLPGAQTINLAHYQGPNPTARAKAYLASTVPNWDKLSNEAQFNLALALKNRSDVIDQPSA